MEKIMKKLFFINSLCIILLFLLPVIIVSIGGIGIINHKDTKFPYEKLSAAETVKVYNHKTGTVEEMVMEEYLCGVLAAEMPASFPLEALKAQAVAARSYLLNKIATGGTSIPEHHGADVCTDSGHCKAWISKEERFAKWEPENAENYWTKLTTAVLETQGEIMTYDSKPVNAVFYAISSGKTENSEDVWGGDVPYLKSADSPYDKNAPGYLTTVEFTYDEFKNKVTAADSSVRFSEEPKSWYTNEKRSEGGAVLTCSIGNKEFKGTEVRTMFGLRSHNFTVEITGGRVIFTVRGFGHGVGMSQWGAKFYAEEGKNYRDILRIYYKGVSFENKKDLGKT